MKNELGVPVTGGSLGAFARERASATPKRRTPEKSTTPDLARSSHTRPARASLRALQEWFAGAVMHPVSVAASVRERGAVGDERVDVDEVERVVLPSARLSAIERIDIYREAYGARLVECLADDYPALRYALGPSAFETLCLAYVAAHPSQSPNLNAFGRHMPAFCRTRLGALSDFGSDLAALEWAMVEVIHVAAGARLSRESLAAIPPSDWPGARFVASETVRVLEFAYPVNPYFQAYNTDAEPSVPEPGWSATAVFRDGATIWRMDLSRAMHALLGALLAGSTLGRALEDVASADLVGAEEAPLVMQWFRDWVGYGFFAAIST